jgi:hypothetical protein
MKLLGSVCPRNSIIRVHAAIREFDQPIIPSGGNNGGCAVEERSVGKGDDGLLGRASPDLWWGSKPRAHTIGRFIFITCSWANYTKPTPPDYARHNIVGLRAEPDELLRSSSASPPARLLRLCAAHQVRTHACVNDVSGLKCQRCLRSLPKQRPSDKNRRVSPLGDPILGSTRLVTLEWGFNHRGHGGILDCGLRIADLGRRTQKAGCHRGHREHKGVFLCGLCVLCG